MLRTTPRPINPNRELYKQYADAQFTFEELLAEFNNYTIYGVMGNISLYIVDNEALVLEFDSIGYDDDDCAITLYEPYPVPANYPFNRMVNNLREDGLAPTKLN